MHPDGHSQPFLPRASEDIVLAKAGLSLEKMLRENAHRVQARVVPWSSYADILDTFRSALER